MSLKDKFKSLKSSDTIASLKRLRVTETVKKAVDGVADVARAFNKIGPSPTPSNYAALAMIILSKLTREGLKEEVWDREDLAFLDLGYSEVFIFSRMRSEGVSEKVFENQRKKFYKVDLWGISYLVLQEGENVYFFYSKTPDESNHREKALNNIGRYLWESLGPKVKVIPVKENDQERIRLERWDLGQKLESGQSKASVDRIKKFFKAGSNRSILFYGNPGTGKSCLVRAIGADINYPTLFIDLASFPNGPSTSRRIKSVVEILRPYVLIIDDIDRYQRHTGAILSILDTFKASLKLFMATANRIEKMDPAVLRTGRFDEVVKVDQVKPFCDMVPGLPEKYRQEVNAWPVSFVEELSLRVNALGKACIPAELVKLRERVKNNKTVSEPEEEECELLEEMLEEAKTQSISVKRIS